SKQQAISLYRNLRREVRKLPHYHLRFFFAIKASDDFRSIFDADNTNGLRDRKIRRVTKIFYQLRDANRGFHSAFESILDMAYGRTGKLKHELLEPLLDDSHTPLPPKMIPAVETSRPPVYSPAMKALLMSTLSRTTKPLKPAYLTHPPTLSERADPSSEAYQVLGPLSKRRDLNTRWRYFVQEKKKIYPPLQVAMHSDAKTVNYVPGGDQLRQQGAPCVGFQGTSAVETLMSITGRFQGALRPLTRKQRRTVGAARNSASSPLEHPNRWLRRRYQTLLARIPVLVPVENSKSREMRVMPY
ncbi:hypothetical protein FISHEDRAFT_10906, partial [Fistulina hepatica ATCC 64428]